MRRALLWTAMIAATVSCGGPKESTPQATNPPPAAGSTATPQPPRPAPQQPPAAAPAAGVPAASTDVDTPTPLATRSIAGAGLKRRVSYFYSLSADAGTVTLTGTGKNAPSASSNALGAAVLTAKAEKLCAISLGNTTQDKKETVNCDVDKPQPLVLRVDLDGPVKLAAPGTAAPAATAAAGPGSTDIDAPTRLAGPVMKGEGTQKPTSYYYALNVGPGEVRLVADGKNQSAATADALHLRLLDLRSEELCGISLGNVLRDDRKIASCTIDRRQPAILRVDLDPATIDWRARVDGAVDYEPYTPPATITIALNERVLFDFGKSTLKPEARQTLDEAAARVKKYPTAKVAIAGHTDNVGSDASNVKLSNDRAAAVRDYFVQQAGIAASRFEVKGYGKAQPVADNATNEGRARNRRVEIVITPTTGANR